MAKDVDPIVVQIAAEFGDVKKDLAALTKEMKKTGDAGAKSAQGVEKMQVSLAAVAKKATIAAAAILSVSAAVKAVSSSLSRGRELTQFASIAGVTRERFSALDIAVRRFGSTGDDLSDVMKDLNVRITDAAENGAEYGNVLRKIGLDAAELVKLRPEQQMLAFADALSRANAQGRKFALDELSDSAVKLDRFFAQGGESIKEMTDGIRDAGMALEEADFAKLEEAAIAQEKLTASFQRLSDIITVKLAPYLTTIFDGLSEAIQSATGDVKDMKKEIEETVTMAGKLEPVVLTGETPLSMFEQYWRDMADIRAAGGELLVAAGEQHRLNELEKEKEAARMNTKIWESGLKGRLNITSKVLGQMSALMNTNSRKQFEIGKAAAIAQVAIDTPKAAMSAYSAMAGIPVVGPALGAAAAAAAVATGIANIQNIKSQSFGGGGGVGGASAGGGGAGVGDASGGGQASEPANVIDATFVLQGEGGFSGDQIRSVAAGLNDFIEDGGQIRSVNAI